MRIRVCLAQEEEGGREGKLVVIFVCNVNVKVIYADEYEYDYDYRTTTTTTYYSRRLINCSYKRLLCRCEIAIRVS